MLPRQHQVPRATVAPELYTASLALSRLTWHMSEIAEDAAAIKKSHTATPASTCIKADPLVNARGTSDSKISSIAPLANFGIGGATSDTHLPDQGLCVGRASGAEQVHPEMPDPIKFQLLPNGRG
ncbi:hypothetical protein BHM03_00062269 [Ensete ventricosum]|nr:hypothetical protein BHM03_00062269 [Ensete ventricosum]